MKISIFFHCTFLWLCFPDIKEDSAKIPVVFWKCKIVQSIFELMHSWIGLQLTCIYAMQKPMRSFEESHVVEKQFILVTMKTR